MKKQYGSDQVLRTKTQMSNNVRVPMEMQPSLFILFIILLLEKKIPTAKGWMADYSPIYTFIGCYPFKPIINKSPTQ